MVHVCFAQRGPQQEFRSIQDRSGTITANVRVAVHTPVEHASLCQNIPFPQIGLAMAQIFD